MIESLGTLFYELVLESLLVSAFSWVGAVLAVRLLRITNPAWRARFFFIPLIIPVLAVPMNHIVVRPLFLRFPSTHLENLLTSLASISPSLTSVFFVLAGLLLLWSAIWAFWPLAAVCFLRLDWRWQQRSPLWLRCNGMLQSAASKMQVSPPRLVLTSGKFCGSLALGPLGVYVVVARALVPMLDDEELEGLLSHELGHIKRKDTVVGVVAGVCYRLLAFSPFAQSAYRKFRWAREEAVDDLAVRFSGRPLALASCLVKACRLAQGQSHQFATSSGLLSPKSAVDSRIQRLLDKATDAAELPSRWYPWAYAGVIASVVVFLLLAV
ncbi:MAG: M48 family metalloprotease [Chloroflexi bacterium]|nr:M48 family metalloprotease [Chloroflexota bacterium]